MSKVVARLRSLRRAWASRPWRVAVLMSLCLLMVFSGPVACITHCLLLDALPQPQPHTHQHSQSALASVVGDDPCAPGHSSQHLPIHDPPSALTVAVIAPPLLLAALMPVVLLQLKLQQILRDVWSPPPDKPPRLSLSSLR